MVLELVTASVGTELHICLAFSDSEHTNEKEKADNVHSGACGPQSQGRSVRVPGGLTQMYFPETAVRFCELDAELRLAFHATN